jgi:hypothetical protein
LINLLFVSFSYLCIFIFNQYPMRYEKVKKLPGQFLSMTGFTIEESDSFLPYFKTQWDEYNERFTLEGSPRRRIFYNRKTGLLPLASDKLLFILSYLKNHPLQEYHAATFCLTQPQCNVWIHLLSNILLKTLKSLDELPDRNPLRMVYQLEQYRDVLLDGTERPVQRPQDSDRQKSRYSGKKKRTV